MNGTNLYSQPEEKIITSKDFSYNHPSNDSIPANPANKKLKYYQYCFDSSHGRVLYLFIRDRGSIEGIAIRKYPSQNVALNSPKTPNSPFLKIHGNILYDVNYYSNIDTPYNQKDVYQHTVQVYLDITVKNHYPIRLYFTTRFSNSLLFKNFTDVNLLYASNLFTQGIEEQLKKKMLASMGSLPKLDSLKNLLDSKYKEFAVLQAWQNNPGTLQKMVEARERAFFKEQKTSINDSVKNGLPSIAKPGDDNFQSKNLQKLIIGELSDSTGLLSFDSSLQSRKDSLFNKYEANRKRADSLREAITALEKKYSELQEQLTNISGITAKEIDAIKNPRELESKMSQLNIADSSMPKGYKKLMALRTVSVGRNIINYSELSVKNISVTGLQVEYNPSYYVAFAAGTVDYRFRDFIVQNYNQPKQYVGVVRVGTGMKDGNNIILTYYAGRKQLYNSFTDTLNQNAGIRSPYIMGFTLEGNYKIGNNNVLTAEVAKSSVPYYAVSNKPENLFSGTVRMKDRSNEAYSLRIASFIPATKTTINGYYKRFGINFQSYSIFTNGSAQSALNIRVDQPFFKRTLDIVASISSNDFTNPYIPQGYKSSTVFKSVQATLRKKNWPVISLGYFPSAQLTKLNDDQYIQNLFYTLMGSINHFYHLHSTMYSTTLLYTQFYNNPGDSSFVYFNTKNLMLSQSIFLRKFTLQFNSSEAINSYYRLYEAGGNIQYKWNKWLDLGGGVKYNMQTEYNIRQIGYSANVTIRVPLLGEFRLMADKGFIPGPDRQLVTNNVGRFTYFKTF